MKTFQLKTKEPAVILTVKEFERLKKLENNGGTSITIEEAISILKGLKDVKNGKIRKVEKFLAELK